MDSPLDVLCACAIFLFVAAASARYGIAFSLARGANGVRDATRRTAVPRVARAIALSTLAPLVRATTALGVSAHTVTAVSFGAGAGAGVLLAFGHFGAAALLFAMASLGDALDGLVARATHSESAAGALFDASVDRYEEFFAFGGLALFFRSSGAMLALTLLALVGSFMVSYGSAKAEALHVAVPHGIMRRAERATYFGTGIALAPIVAAFSRRFGGPLWAGNVPLVLAVTLIGVTANVSAARRLRDIAAAVSTYGSLPRSAAPAREPVKTRVVGADAE